LRGSREIGSTWEVEFSDTLSKAIALADDCPHNKIKYKWAKDAYQTAKARHPDCVVLVEIDLGMVTFGEGIETLRKLYGKPVVKESDWKEAFRSIIAAGSRVALVESYPN
jgi:hypothetical protein